jgi:hypothetical protein
MNEPPPTPIIALSDCEICSRLGEVETSFSKYGWDDMTRSLPPEAARLTPAEDTSTYQGERHHVRRCPLCGTFYRYDQTYEYLVNGSEDEEVLVRLTPDEARNHLTDQQYASLIAWMHVALEHPHSLMRSYAGKCLASHYLALPELGALASLLLHGDQDAVRGALAWLARKVSTEGPQTEMQSLALALQQLALTAPNDISERALYVAGRLTTN